MPKQLRACDQTLSSSAVRALRLRAALQTPPANLDLASQISFITNRLLAVQAQDSDALLLSYWLRLPSPRPSRKQLSALVLEGPSEADVIRVWGNRVTLQCVRRDDVGALLRSVRNVVEQRRFSAVRRAGMGEQGVEMLERVQELTVKELKKGIEVDSGVVKGWIEQEMKQIGASFTEKVKQEVSRSLKYSVFVFLTVNGIAERVLRAGKKNMVVAKGVDNGSREPDFEEALSKCALQYFKGYGPATEGDFRYWMGIPAGSSKKAVQGLVDSGKLLEIETEGGEMILSNEMNTEWDGVEDGVRFVGRFEPILLAHKSKQWLVEEDERKRVWNTFSDVRACVLIKGRIRGTWRRDKKDIRIRLFFEESVEDVKEILIKATDILEGFYAGKGEAIVEMEMESGKVGEVRKHELCHGKDQHAQHSALFNGRKRKASHGKHQVRRSKRIIS